jgi:hypothetical protein
MLHLPMQSENATAKTEEVELRVGMNEQQVDSALAGMLETVPHAVGREQSSRIPRDGRSCVNGRIDAGTAPARSVFLSIAARWHRRWPTARLSAWECAPPRERYFSMTRRIAKQSCSSLNLPLTMRNARDSQSQLDIQGPTRSPFLLSTSRDSHPAASAWCSYRTWSGKLRVSLVEKLIQRSSRLKVFGRMFPCFFSSRLPLCRTAACTAGVALWCRRGGRIARGGHSYASPTNFRRRSRHSCSARKTECEIA